jgi:hypothetical protein
VLTYDVANEWLSGKIGNQEISLRACSGGGRASKVHPGGKPGQLGLASWNTQRKQNDARGIRGGPLPVGMYMVQKPAHHPDLKLSAYLQQTLTSMLYENPAAPTGVAVTKRDGFYIHGRGPKGSDGCIVPMEKFDELMTLLRAHAPLLLKVVNAGARLDKLPPPLPGNIG